MLRSRAANDVQQGNSVRPESSASLHNDGDELGVVMACNGCVLASLGCLYAFHAGSGSVGLSPAVGAQRMHHSDVRQHVLARVYEL
jgi:hypothetical protein